MHRILSQNQLNQARVLTIEKEMIKYPGRAVGCEIIVGKEQLEIILGGLSAVGD